MNADIRQLLAIKYCRDALLDEYDLKDLLSLDQRVEISTKVGDYDVVPMNIDDEIFFSLYKPGKQTPLAEGLPLIAVRAYPKTDYRDTRSLIHCHNLTRNREDVMSPVEHEVLKGYELLCHLGFPEDGSDRSVYLLSPKGDVIQMSASSLEFMFPVTHVPTRTALASALSCMEEGLVNGQWQDESRCVDQLYLVERALHHGHVDGVPLHYGHVLRGCAEFFEEQPLNPLTASLATILHRYVEEIPKHAERMNEHYVAIANLKGPSLSPE